MTDTLTAQLREEVQLCLGRTKVARKAIAYQLAKMQNVNIYNSNLNNDLIVLWNIMCHDIGIGVSESPVWPVEELKRDQNLVRDFVAETIQLINDIFGQEITEQIFQNHFAKKYKFYKDYVKNSHIKNIKFDSQYIQGQLEIISLLLDIIE